MSALAATAAALFAVDPVGIGGVLVRGRPGPQRDAWLATLQALLPPDAPWRRVPPRIQDDALLGGIDLAATLRAGRTVARPGLLAQIDGGVLLLPMAERIEPTLAARLGAVLDTGRLVLAREGLSAPVDARCGLVALDESIEADEAVPTGLADRLGLHLTLGTTGEADATPAAIPPAQVAQARERLPWVACDDASIEALCAASLALGIASLRAPLQALRVARAAAALQGRDAVDASDAALAARLVLAPRATRLPPADAPPPESTPEPEPQAAPRPEAGEPPPPTTAPPAEGDEQADDTPPPAPDSQALAEMVLAAARAAIPPGLLASLAVRNIDTAASTGGGAGAMRTSRQRGRAIGGRRGSPRGGARLDIVATLRAAAPWQLLRAREWQAANVPGAKPPQVHVRPGDFHVSRLRQRSPTTTVFVVDASGSAALHRLAEAKGAVELLLADCYVRRDRVALLAFRGEAAELLLPPTRSLTRAKRSLAGLPGGGGTPLAHGIDAARELAEQLHRRGETPVLVLLTDGRGNIARDGARGRAQAETDAMLAARALGRHGFAALLLDTSPQPHPAARVLAEAMGARYLPMPHGDAAGMSGAVRSAGLA